VESSGLIRLGNNYLVPNCLGKASGLDIGSRVKLCSCSTVECAPVPSIHDLFEVTCHLVDVATMVRCQAMFHVRPSAVDRN